MARLTDDELLHAGKIISKRYGDDVGQETIVALIEMSERTEVEHYMAVAVTIARRLTRNEYRREKLMLPSGLMADCTLVSCQDPEAATLAKDILEKLDPHLIWYYTEGKQPSARTDCWERKRRQRLKADVNDLYADCI